MKRGVVMLNVAGYSIGSSVRTYLKNAKDGGNFSCPDNFIKTITVRVPDPIGE